MTKPPKQKAKQVDYVQTALRLPSELRDQLRASAEHNGRSLNAEILARLQTEHMEEMRRLADEIKGMLRLLLDRT